MSWSVRKCIMIGAVLALSTTSSLADGVADFYRGKQIQFYIRAAPGGNYDLYSRLLGQYMTRYLPGHPNILPVNMPGGGGLVALNYVANVAPKDGTALTIMTQTFPMEQALSLDSLLKVDLRTLNWIGDMSDSNELYFTSKNSPTKTLEDAKRRVTVLAATGNGSITAVLAALYNNTLGTKFKIIYGYPSGPDMTLAMERGEVEGRSVSNPDELAATPSDAQKKYNFLIQTGLDKLPGYQQVPLLRDLAANDDERRIFDFVSNGVVIARPLVTNAGVPKERVAALRQAFDEAMRDPGFLADAKRQGMQISAKSAPELKKLIADLLDAPAGLRKEVARAIVFKSSDENARGARSGGGRE
jgi:tripartite-type tricarboxylate transporter receptor subunit TctC